MKKSVVILIGIIYIASIAVVSFFGLQYKMFEEIVYSDGLVLLNTDVKTSEKGEKYVVIMKGADPDKPYEYLIEYRLMPDNVTNKQVNFSYDASTAEKLGFTIDETGLASFKKSGVITVRMVPADGSNIELSLKLIAY